MPTIDELLVMVDELLEGTEDSVAGLVSLREYYEGRGITNLEVNRIGKYDELFDQKGAVEVSNVLERYARVYSFFCRFTSIPELGDLVNGRTRRILYTDFEHVHYDACWQAKNQCWPTAVRQHMVDSGKEIALPRLPLEFEPMEIEVPFLQRFIAYLRGINGILNAYTDTQRRTRQWLIDITQEAQESIPDLLLSFQEARRILLELREELIKLRAQQKKRMLALAMAGHHRLGGNSLLRGLSDDVLRTVWEMENRNYEYGRWLGNMCR